jgi:hypothetical protein
MPGPGGAFGGGYFAGQILVLAGQEGGGLPAVDTLYNLVVAPVTSGGLNGQFGGATPGVISYKTSNSADTPTATVTNYVYGGQITNLFATSAAHPVFNTFINGATGPNAGSFNLTTGGSGTGTGIGGYNDWYLPAVYEFWILYFFLKPNTIANDTTWGSNPNSVAPYTPNTNYGPGFPNQTTSTLFQSPGGSQAFDLSQEYWTANEAPLDFIAISCVYSTGGLNGTGSALKSATKAARAMRRVPA